MGTLAPDRVGTEAFAPFTYGALGHLHGPQVLADGLRYSGSPVAFSFSERHHRKGSWLVDLGRAGALSVVRVEAPVHRRLTQLSGTLEDLLRDDRHAGAEADHVKAVLTDAARPADAMRRLQARFPHAVALEWAPQGRVPELPYAQRLAAATSDTEVAAGFVAHVRGTPATDAERAALDAAFRAVAVAAGEHLPGDPVALSRSGELAVLDDDARRARRRPRRRGDGRRRPGRGGARRRPRGRGPRGGGRLMRPHRLRVTAFGPFAGTVDVDLDEVSAAGPFLLRGATGRARRACSTRSATPCSARSPGRGA